MGYGNYRNSYDDNEYDKNGSDYQNSPRESKKSGGRSARRVAAAAIAALLVITASFVWDRVVTLRIHCDFINTCRRGTPFMTRLSIALGADVNSRSASGNPALMLAAQDNQNPEVISALIKAGADVNAQNGGWTALHSAVYFNPNPEITALLVKNGADVNANSDGWTPLLLAAERAEDRQVIDALVDAGADVNARDKSNWTALMIAVRHNKKTGAAIALIERGADVNASIDGWTPLAFAAKYSDNPRIIASLIENGADANARIGGWTPLALAVRNENPRAPDVIAALLKGGANLDMRNKNMGTAREIALRQSANPGVITALSIDVNERDAIERNSLAQAAESNVHPEMFYALAERGADVNARDFMGNTPLIIAAGDNENPDVLFALIKIGADVNAVNNYGYTPLIAAIQRYNNYGAPSDYDEEIENSGDDSRGHYERQKEEAVKERKRIASIVKRLLAEGADPNVGTDENGLSAIFIALYNGSDPDVILALADHGAKTNIKCGYWDGALDAALSLNRGHEIVSALIYAGGDTDWRDRSPGGNRATILQRAIRDGSPPDVIWTLARASNIEARDKRGNTALMTAARRGKKTDAEVVSHLIKLRADVNATDAAGRSVLQIAEDAECSAEVLELLKQSGAKREPDVSEADEKFLSLCRRGAAPDIASAIKSGANTNAMDRTGRTALMEVVAGMDVESASLLARSGANVNARDNAGDPVIMFAVSRPSGDGGAAMIDALAKNGADINARDVDGNTPLFRADPSGVDIISALIGNGADVNATNANGVPLLSSIFLNSRKAFPETISLLIKNGADPNARDEDERTPLLAATRVNGDARNVAALISGGADVNARDNRGRTALHNAARSDANGETLALLIKSGANLNAQTDEGLTPLMEAANPSTFNGDVMMALIDAGADVNAQDKRGRTALIIAAPRLADDKSHKALLAAGADASIKDNRGRTAADYNKDLEVSPQTTKGD
jgi:ankyrin repeat protein